MNNCNADITSFKVMFLLIFAFIIAFFIFFVFHKLYDFINKSQIKRKRSLFATSLSVILNDFMDNDVDFEIYRSDIFSGGVIAKYKGYVFRVSCGIGYSVLIYKSPYSDFDGSYSVPDDVSERFYHFLENKYQCFTTKLPLYRDE